MVQDEKDANFISRLHADKLQIIPWPMIGSKEFYKLFGALKRKLDQQPTSHHTAGEFLHTSKTLMAKLKVWFASFSPTWVTDQCRVPNRPTIGEQCHVGPLRVLIYVLLLNLYYRNHGSASGKYSA